MEVFSSWWGSKAPVPPDNVAKNGENDGTITLTADDDGGDQTRTNVVSENNVNNDEENIPCDVSLDNTKINSNDGTPVDAVKTATDWGSYLFNVAKEGTKVVTNTATKTAGMLQKTVEDKTFMGEFNKEQERFMKEKHSKRSEAAVAPWVGYNEEEQIREHILALSKDKRNFLRNPPAGVQFHFDFDSSFPVAMAMLQEDPNLNKMRFELVPKSVNEENFWRNYFYRVSLIKQSSQLTSLATTTGNNGESGKHDRVIKSNEDCTKELQTETSSAIDIEKPDAEEDDTFTDLPPDSPPANEFISDAFSSEVDQADLQKGMEQLGMTDKEEPSQAAPNPTEDVPEWEKELQQELKDFEVVGHPDGEVNDEEWEAEINQMLEAEVEADQHKPESV